MLCAACHRCLQELQGKLDGSKEEIKELQSQEEDILGGSLRLVWSVWRLQDLRGQLKSQQELQGEVQDCWLLSSWTCACHTFFPILEEAESLMAKLEARCQSQTEEIQELPWFPLPFSAS